MTREEQMPVMGRRLLVATLLLLVLAAAFWRLDFRAARSNSHAQSQVTTIGGGRGGKPATAGRPGHLRGGERRPGKGNG